MDLSFAVQEVLQPTIMLFMAVGVIAGIVVGAIPGLSATMAMALMIPFTFGMSSGVAISVLMAIYVCASQFSRPEGLNPSAAFAQLKQYSQKQEGFAGVTRKLGQGVPGDRESGRSAANLQPGTQVNQRWPL